MSGKTSQLRIAGKSVPVSNLEKVFYPTGFTKGDVINYYIRVAPLLLPHLKRHPVTLKRYPNGVNGGFFYEKKCPPYRPVWVKTAPMFSKGNNADINYCLIDNLASLVWAANLADLELHTFLWRAKNYHVPAMLVFDLDPGEPADLLNCAAIALRLKEIFAKWKLDLFPKTSGSKGMQVYLPLNTPVKFDQTGAFAQAVAQSLERERPKEVVSKMTKNLRKGKVFVDWSQNHEHKTTVCVYSLRAKERPMVSTPLQWKEVETAVKKGKTDGLVFAAEEALKRIEKLGDLFKPVLTLKQRLPKLDGLAAGLEK